MFLYNKNGNKIEVFDMQPDSQRIIDYKKEQIANEFGIDGSILKAVTNSHQDKVLENQNETVMLKDVEKNTPDLMGDSMFSTLRQVEANEETRALLANYYTNDFQYSRAKRIVDYNQDRKSLVTLKYLLLTRSRYSSKDTSGYHNMENIIELNQQLFHLHLLGQEQFSRLVDEDISEQLALYSVKHDRDVNVATLKEMYDVRLLPGTFEGVMQNVETTGKILQKIR